jgi:Ca2+-binding RTX toxin-like protein
MKSSQSPRTSLGLETLEGRANPSTLLSNGDLYIYGTSGSDHVEVHAQTIAGTNYIQVTENGVNHWFNASQVWGGDIYFQGYAGNDYMNNYVGSLRLTAFGGDGNDTLIGDAANDHLYGNAGSDYLYGYGGNDVLGGGTGVDHLYGMSGNDYLEGGNDGVHDYLTGGTGADHFRREPTFLWFGNRDTPTDFVSGVDSYWS